MTRASSEETPRHDAAPDGTPPRGDTALVIALASGATPAEAAERAGISRRTAYRRLDDPLFRARVQEERDILVKATLGRLTDASLAAADTLRSIASDIEMPATTRITAAKAILETGARLREQADLVERLDRLEYQLDDKRAAWAT